MRTRLEQWLRFLRIDDDTIDTLRKHSPLMAGHLPNIMDSVYSHIGSQPASANMFPSAESMSRARRMQLRHWRDHVFAGNFNDEYLNTTRTIGQTHHRVGVDLHLYVGAYSIVQDELLKAVARSLSEQPDEREKLVSAINRAIYLDMGLATSVYYESVMGAVEEMAHELNFSLARAGEFRDNETGKHILRMSRMCFALARAIGKDMKWAHMLQVASPLHDVGKIGIPDQILLKPGRLTDSELVEMRRHPGIGGQIIPDHPAEVIRMARRISLTHHERWDGTGYPAGLRGTEIPLEGRIAALCDVYDALASERPYKAPWPRERILAYLHENRGSHFDPELVDSFLSILPEIDEIQAQFAETEPQPRLMAV